MGERGGGGEREREGEIRVRSLDLHATYFSLEPEVVPDSVFSASFGTHTNTTGPIPTEEEEGGGGGGGGGRSRREEGGRRKEEEGGGRVVREGVTYVVGGQKIGRATYPKSEDLLVQLERGW